jgi:hypothetical protein
VINRAGGRTSDRWLTSGMSYLSANDPQRSAHELSSILATYNSSASTDLTAEVRQESNTLD